MHIYPDIYLVGSGRSGINLSDEYDCHIFLLDGGDEVALIEAGSGVDIAPLLSNIEALGVKSIDYLILTHGHADHSGGAAALRRHFGCQVMLSEAEAEMVETGDPESSGLNVALPSGIYPPGYTMPKCPIDRRLQDGDRITVGRYELQVIATPGHSLGSLCFLMNAGGKRVLFTGDVIQYCPAAGQIGWISLLNCPGSDLHAYRESVRRLADLRVDVLLPSHRLWTLGNGQRVIDSLIQGFAGLSLPRSVI